MVVFVFGTLLGPEATGPGFWPWDFVSGSPAAPITRLSVCGVCGVGLLFENYIVDASILYKKQFPRYLEPGSGRTLVWLVSWFSRVSLFLIFVVKFLRAHGGCLGIRSRRRT